jgi:toxin HigB-1
MIKTFQCKETKKIWEGYVSKKYPFDIQERAFKKLRQLDSALELYDLKNPPGNNLEYLKGDRKGQMSIRINQQWRLCFVWKDNGAYDVEIVDYH